MVFSSAIFLWLFLPFTFVLNLIVGKKYSNAFLLLASLIFYAWGEPVNVLLMIAVIAINWLVGWIIGGTEGKTRRLALIAGIACDLGVLGYYKYAAFFASLLNSVFRQRLFERPAAALPIGISFFTFQAISYIADVYRGETEPSPRLTDMALYISFFPQLIAGPIVKYRDIRKQIEKRTVSFDGVTAGFRRFLYGLSKKVLISNVLGLCVDTIYEYKIAQVDWRMAWIGALAYMFQIYYDFSGYSDMAIGLGKMLGFDIPENFNYPYLSGSITEFWKRWHISLGSWFKEYLYIPLGGNRKGKTRTYINLTIVFLLTGLWHGAALSFIVWGLYHGFFSILERLGLKKILDKRKGLAILYCFLVVDFGWVLFRAQSIQLALAYISRMILPWRYADVLIPIWNYADGKTIFTGFCAFLGMGILKRATPARIEEKWKNSAAEAVYCVFLLILCLAAIASDTYNPFIYFQF